MVKTFGLMGLAAVAALILGFGSQLGSATPKAHADTTGVAVIGCEFIASAVDGDTTNATTLADLQAACGIANTPLPATAPDAGSPPVPQPSIAHLANAIGDKDGKLELSDFDSAPNQKWDDNQISTACTAPGLYCTLDVFVFVNDESTVTLNLPSGLSSLEGAAATPATNDAICNSELNPVTVITSDADCVDGGAPGDGVVLFHVLEGATGGAKAGDVKSVIVKQDSVEQPFDVNVVGLANDVKLTLAETSIETNGSTANTVACTGTSPANGTATDVTDAIAPATSTLAYAQVFDADDVVMTRVPVLFTITPASATDIAKIGLGDVTEGITGNTLVSLDPATSGAPTAAFAVICAGKSSGTATVKAAIGTTVFTASGGNVITASDDSSTADITVTGAPSAVALTATPATIKCDGTETATVSAKVTDSKGNSVADGVPVTFNVVALGTANPINAKTVAGIATTTVTPLSNSSAGVTVIVSAGSSNIATQIQTSVRVDCALPLVTQPTAPAGGGSPVAGSPTPRSGIGGPDTGTGGYLGQNDASAFPMWTLVVLALGSVVLVAGGAAARRAK